MYRCMTGDAHSEFCWVGAARWPKEPRRLANRLASQARILGMVLVFSC